MDDKFNSGGPKGYSKGHRGFNEQHSPQKVPTFTTLDYFQKQCNSQKSRSLCPKKIFE